MNLQTIINRVKKKSSHSKLVVSSLLLRKDKPGIDLEVTKLNEKLKALCEENVITFMCNDNIDDSCLGRGKLHPNEKGKAYLAMNLVNCISENM